MTVRKFVKITSAVGMLLALSACNEEYSAVADLPGSATARMSVTPLFSLQSDWNRALTVSDGETTASIDLFEDTGWWRGSHLYLHASGAYVLHEGQNGCRSFTLDPVSFAHRASISCAKMADTDTQLPAGSPQLNGYPASKYYAEMFYVGRFVEAQDVPESRDEREETPILFQTFEQKAEPELPGTF